MYKQLNYDYIRIARRYLKSYNITQDTKDIVNAAENFYSASYIERGIHHKLGKEIEQRIKEAG